MPEVITRDDGTEIELNDDEVEAIKSKAVEEFREANPDVDRIDELKSAAEEAQAKLTEIEEKQAQKGQNMSELRKQKEAAEKDAKEANEKVTSELKRIEGMITNKTKSETMKSLIGDDEEMNKKALHIYDVVLSGMPSTTDVEIAERVKAAVRLAKPDKTPDTMGYEVRSSAGSGMAPKISNEDLGIASQYLGVDKIKQNKAAVEEMRKRRQENG